MNQALEINRKHGEAMYNIALEHAINMIEIAGVEALPLLKTKLAKAKKEQENE